MSQTRPIDMRAMLRLATWGCAAAAALLLAVLTATTGSQRPTVAASDEGPGADTQASPRMPELAARLTARTTEVENRAQRLSEAVSALAADRDRLITRIASLERGLEDLTGSIKQKAATDPAALPAIAAATPSNQSRPVTAPPAAPAAIAPAATAPRASPAEPPARVAKVVEAPQAEQPKAGDFGIDVGGATTFEGLRALWNSVKGASADMLEDLHPMVAVRENRSRGVDLRLIVGPIASTEAATQMCASLLAARRFCQMTLFEGQPLPQSVPEPERRPVVAPARSSNQPKSRPPRP